MSGANFHVDSSTCVKMKFRVARNSVLLRCGYADEFLKSSLAKSKCVPLLTYCLSALVLSRSEVRNLGVCSNDCFLKIFKYNRWEPVPVFELQQWRGEPLF